MGSQPFLLGANRNCVVLEQGPRCLRRIGRASPQLSESNIVYVSTAVRLVPLPRYVLDLWAQVWSFRPTSATTKSLMTRVARGSVRGDVSPDSMAAWVRSVQVQTMPPVCAQGWPYPGRARDRAAPGFVHRPGQGWPRQGPIRAGWRCGSRSTWSDRPAAPIRSLSRGCRRTRV